MTDPLPVASSFNKYAADYDATRRGLVTPFDQFYGAALNLIADWRGPSDPRVLDLGAGTGLFASLVLSRRPGLRVHLFDVSTGMLDLARDRLAAEPGVTFETGDMAADFPAGPWDLVISALAIHHLDDSGKRTLFRRVRDSLAPGGLFVNAEQVLGPTSEAEDRYERIWLAEARANGVAEEEIRKAKERMAHDRCATVEDQLVWLRDAGFNDVDCSFKAWRFAVLSGRK